MHSCRSVPSPPPLTACRIESFATVVGTIGGQAFGAGRFPLVGMVAQRAILINLLLCVFILLLWTQLEPMMLVLGEVLSNHREYSIVVCFIKHAFFRSGPGHCRPRQAVHRENLSILGHGCSVCLPEGIPHLPGTALQSKTSLQPFHQLTSCSSD